jgi:hypothetical protein
MEKQDFRKLNAQECFIIRKGAIIIIKSGATQKKDQA